MLDQDGCSKPSVCGLQSDGLRSIIDRIRPAVLPLMRSYENDDALCDAAIRANIAASVEHLRHGSAMLARLANDGSLRIVGAEYSLETGAVEFL